MELNNATPTTERHKTSTVSQGNENGYPGIKFTAKKHAGKRTQIVKESTGKILYTTRHGVLPPTINDQACSIVVDNSAQVTSDIPNDSTIASSTDYPTPDPYHDDWIDDIYYEEQTSPREAQLDTNRQLLEMMVTTLDSLRKDNMRLAQQVEDMHKHLDRFIPSDGPSADMYPSPTTTVPFTVSTPESRSLPLPSPHVSGTYSARIYPLPTCSPAVKLIQVAMHRMNSMKCFHHSYHSRTS